MRKKALNFFYIIKNNEFILYFLFIVLLEKKNLVLKESNNQNLFLLNESYGCKIIFLLLIKVIKVYIKIYIIYVGNSDFNNFFKIFLRVKVVETGFYFSIMVHMML